MNKKVGNGNARKEVEGTTNRVKRNLRTRWDNIKKIPRGLRREGFMTTFRKATVRTEKVNRQRHPKIKGFQPLKSKGGK